jgi:hypothetical protein
MKRWLRWLLAVLGGFCLLLLVAWLSMDPLLRSMAERRAREQLGLRIEIGQLKTGLLSGSVALKELNIFNPPAFGAAMLARIPEFSCVLDLSQAMTNRLRLRDLKLRLRELNVIKDKDGRLNFDAIKTIIDEAMKHGSHSYAFGGIERLELTLEKVNYIDRQQPENNLNLDLGVRNEVATNLETEEQLSAWLNAFLFRIVLKQSLKSSEGKGPGLNFLWKQLAP